MAGVVRVLVVLHQSLSLAGAPDNTAIGDKRISVLAWTPGHWEVDGLGRGGMGAMGVNCAVRHGRGCVGVACGGGGWVVDQSLCNVQLGLSHLYERCFPTAVIAGGWSDGPFCP
jgi:hypothetical protein